MNYNIAICCSWLRPEVIADSASKDFTCIIDGSEIYSENVKGS